MVFFTTNGNTVHRLVQEISIRFPEASALRGRTPCRLVLPSITLEILYKHEVTVVLDDPPTLHTPLLGFLSSASMLFTAALVASLAASVSAHATFQEMWVNGVDQGNYCVRLPASNSPVTSVTTNVSSTKGSKRDLTGASVGSCLQCRRFAVKWALCCEP